MLTLAAYCWKNARFPTARALAVFLALMSLWSLLAAVNFHLSDLESKILVNRWRMIAPTLSSLSLMYLVKSLNPRWRWPKIVWGLLTIIPAIGVFILISPYHEQFITGYRLLPVGTHSLLTFENGAWFTIHNIYSRVIVLISITLILTANSDSHRSHRISTTFVFSAITVPFLIDSLGVMYFPIIRYLQLTPAFLMVTGVALMYVVFRHHFHSVIPIARNMALDNTDDFYLIFNIDKKLVDYNLTATEILSLQNHHIGSDQEYFFNLHPQLKKNSLNETTIKSEKYSINEKQIKDNDGVLLGTIFTFKNITLSKKVEANLEELHRLKGNILAIMGHDLQANLGNLKIISEELYTNCRSMEADQIRTKTESMYLSSMNCIKFIDELLIWAKTQHETFKVRHETINLGEALHKTVSFMMPLAETKNLQIKISLDHSIVLKTDPSIIATIVRNLISNAIKFSSNDSQITITSYKANSDLLISVSDSGAGFFGKIEEYAAAHPLQSNKGLGLYICHELAHYIGGQLSAQLKADGGSVFTFTLPLSKS